MSLLRWSDSPRRCKVYGQHWRDVPKFLCILIPAATEKAGIVLNASVYVCMYVCLFSQFTVHSSHETAEDMSIRLGRRLRLGDSYASVHFKVKRQSS